MNAKDFIMGVGRHLGWYGNGPRGAFGIDNDACWVATVSRGGGLYYKVTYLRGVDENDRRLARVFKTVEAAKKHAEMLWFSYGKSAWGRIDDR